MVMFVELQYIVLRSPYLLASRRHTIRFK